MPNCACTDHDVGEGGGREEKESKAGSGGILICFSPLRSGEGKHCVCKKDRRRNGQMEKQGGGGCTYVSPLFLPPCRNSIEIHRIMPPFLPQRCPMLCGGKGRLITGHISKSCLCCCCDRGLPPFLLFFLSISSRTTTRVGGKRETSISSSSEFP